DAGKLGVAEAVIGVAGRALAKEPEARYRDLGEMADALEQAMGLPTVPSLSPEARAKAYERHFAEARRLLAERAPEGGPLSARRAQSLDPTRTGIVALVAVIEQQLRHVVTAASGSGAPLTLAPTATRGFSATSTILPTFGSATQEALR